MALPRQFGRTAISAAVICRVTGSMGSVTSLSWQGGEIERCEASPAAIAGRWQGHAFTAARETSFFGAGVLLARRSNFRSSPHARRRRPRLGHGKAYEERRGHTDRRQAEEGRRIAEPIADPARQGGADRRADPDGEADEAEGEVEMPGTA